MSAPERPHGCACSESQEEYPTAGESLIESCKKRANRTPGYGYLPLRHASSASLRRSVAGAAQAGLSTGSRSHLLLPAHGLRGRYPHSPGWPLDRFPVSPPPGLSSVDCYLLCGIVSSVPSLVATNIGDMISRPASLKESRILAFRFEWVRGIPIASLVVAFSW